jgi:hypothetical protein
MRMLPTRIVFSLLGAALATSPTASTAPTVPRDMSEQSDLAAAHAELARVQTAMGGAAELAKITSLRISSTAARWASDGAPRKRPEKRVLHMLLPHYVLFEVEGDPRRGWAVAEPIASTGEPAASKALLKDAFAYVALRTLLRTDTPMPLTLRAFANGSLQYDAPNGVKVFLDIDPQTHLPSRLHYADIGRTNAGDAIPGRTVAQRWDLEDYRVVGKLRLAHRWTWFFNEQRASVDQVDTVDLNPPMTPKDFIK